MSLVISFLFCFFTAFCSKIQQYRKLQMSKSTHRMVITIAKLWLYIYNQYELSHCSVAWLPIVFFLWWVAYYCWLSTVLCCSDFSLHFRYIQLLDKLLMWVSHSRQGIIFSEFCLYLVKIEWLGPLGSLVVRALDLQPGEFNSWPWCCQVTVLGKLFTPMYNLISM